MFQNQLSSFWAGQLRRRQASVARRIQAGGGGLESGLLSMEPSPNCF